MKCITSSFIVVLCTLLFGCSDNSPSQTSDLPVREDPLVRMPGTQPEQVTLESSTTCYACHGGGNGPWVTLTPDLRGRTDYNEYDIYKAWQGSMMGNSARDPLMFACFTVSAQDSIFALGNPNAVDICLRCHFPKGWLEGRSSTLNASAMTGEDYDGIQCSFCHRLTDPFYRTTFDGTREGSDWTISWDEQNSALVLPQFRSQPRALQTFLIDQMFAPRIALFSGDPFYAGDIPVSALYTESAGGQYFVSPTTERRGPYADVFSNGAAQPHATQYSRFHKGKFFCATCHDVSNPVIANMKYKNTRPGQKVLLDTETLPAFAWSHVERTYSEFRLSAYNATGGADGKGNFRPNTPVGTFPVNGWETDQPGNKISKCQDCHMCSRYSTGSSQPDSPVRPEDSSEHPNTWMPCHAMTGGNVWMTSILSSIAPDNPMRDLANVSLLVRPDILTMDVMQGTWQTLRPPQLNPALVTPSISGALDLAASRIRGVLGNAANISDLNYNNVTGSLGFRVQNNTGHKLISGFPEGRRMFVNIQVFQGTSLVYEINPYDYTYGTFKGFPGAQQLSMSEAHLDPLVYEAKLGSTITGERETFHFALATHRYKDNRIPPKGFNIAGAAARLSEPVWQGQSSPAYFTGEEYAGGYDEVSLQVPPGATSVAVNLYYQTTSREYIEFLRDEINGTGNLTLPASAYVAQTHPFFARLKAWGNTIFQLWDRNKNVDGGKPFLMTQGIWSVL
ncbi:MAG: hypothetical protein IPQ16_07250 [Geobacteraceae bacterium]|nr:hypothetical protein [Geobacteraceae bacterium]